MPTKQAQSPTESPPNTPVSTGLGPKSPGLSPDSGSSTIPRQSHPRPPTGPPRSNPGSGASERDREKILGKEAGDRPRKQVARKVKRTITRGGEDVPHLPKPPSVKMNDPGRFFQYWKTTDKAYPDRLTCYVYRLWPVIDRKRLDKNSNIGQEPAPVDEDGIYARFGEGDYKIILSDGILHKQVCYTILKGFRDPTNFPAQIEYEDVVVDDPYNQSWIERMKMKGVRFPGDEPEEVVVGGGGGGADSAVAQLTSTVERLALSQMRRESPKSSLDAAMSSTMLDTVAQASKMGNEILQSAFKQANEVGRGERVTMSADPVDQLRTVVEVAKAIAPPPVVPTDMTPFMNMMMESNRSTMEAQVKAATDRTMMLEKMVEDMRKERLEMMKPREDQQDPLKQIDRVLTIQQKLMEANPAAESSTPGWVQAVMQFAPVGIQLLSQAATSFAAAMYNRAVANTGTGQPVPPPNPAQTQPQAIPGAIPGAMPGATPGAPGTGAPDPSSDTSGGMGMYMEFLNTIAEPLLNHVTNPDMTGADFADWLVRSQSNGQLIYMSLREQGKDAIVQLLQQHEPLWNQLRQIPQSFDRFLDEFMAYAEEEQEGQDNQETQGGRGDEALPQSASAPTTPTAADMVVDVEPADEVEPVPDKQPTRKRRTNIKKEKEVN